jgi:intracellular septation protein
MAPGAPTAPAAPEPPRGFVNFALDFGPLLAFFAAYRLAKQGYGDVVATLIGTGVFMAAVLAAMAWSLFFYRRVSPMMWISAVLVIGFGGLTLWFRDPGFIQLKPTIIYVGFAAILFGGLAAGQPLLKYIFGPIFPGLSDLGWTKISRNWAVFFVVLAVANEALRHSVSFDTWLTCKTFGFTAGSFVFALGNIPMLLRHGLQLEAAKDPTPPPTQ